MKVAGFSGILLTSVDEQSPVLAAPTPPLHHQNVSRCVYVWCMCVAADRERLLKHLVRARIDSPPKLKGGREGYARAGDLSPPLPLWPKKEGLGDLSFSVHFLPPFPFDFVSLAVFLFFQCCSHLSPALFLPLDPAYLRLTQPSSPNLETPPLRSRPRPAGPSRHQGGGVCPRGAELVRFSHLST